MCRIYKVRKAVEGGENRVIQLVNYPLKNKFYDLVMETNKNIRLCAPFVKEGIINDIYRNKKQNVDVEIISNFNMANFYKGSSDIEAFKIILENGGKVFNFQLLHAKIYIFDERYTLITSSNLTRSGFDKNLEYGVLLKDKLLVSKTIEDYKLMCSNDTTGTIDYRKVARIEKILKSISDGYHFRNEMHFHVNEVDNLLNTDKDLLQANMSPWQKLTFDIINLIHKDVFSLTEVYKYEQIFQSNYPDNNTIRDSIRRNLQELRDIGLVKFLGNGVYKKLWV